MANFTYIENAHVFSKAPVQLNMEASSAVNKSVHTVQSNEIWGEVCPFITRETVKDLEEDTLFELDGYAPVKFNYKKPAIVLDAINNNGMKSNGYVAKVIIDSKPITQFIADTDVTDATGKLASGYRAVLYDKTGGEVADSKYTINYSNGLIYFKEPIESTLDSHYTLSFFTYEGVKLDTTIADIKADVIENANNHSELSEKVDNIEDDYKEADIEINNNISNLSSKVADNKEKLEIAEASIENLDDRLIVIEENILDLDENISKLNSTVSSDLSEHINNSEIHVSEKDRELWNKGGNMSITCDDFITPEKTDTGWKLTLDTSNSISSSNILNENEDKKVPTSNAVKKYVDTNLIDPTIYLFPELSKEERKYYMIFDAWQNPIYASFTDEVIDGHRLFAYRSWKKFHIKSFTNMTKGWRMFHNNRYLKSFKCNFPALTIMDEFFSGCNQLEYLEGDFSSVTTINSSFNNVSALHTLKCNFDSIKNGNGIFGAAPLKYVDCTFRDLVTADSMFNSQNAKLTLESLKNIAEALPDVNNITENGATKTIGIKCEIVLNTDTNLEIEEARNKIESKGWNLNLQIIELEY